MMRLKLLTHLLASTFLIGTSLLNTGEASGQRVSQPPKPPPVATRPPTIPSPHTVPTIPPQIIIDRPPPVRTPFPPIPRTPEATATRAPQPVRAAEAAITPPPAADTATSDADDGDEIPTPSPEITPTVTPPQLSLPTATPDSVDATPTPYPTPTPSPSMSPTATPAATPTATPTPTPDDPPLVAGFGSWWPWLLGGIVVVLITIWATRRRGSRY